jgi:tetratricopeptide (TPR) repeat protein
MKAARPSRSTRLVLLLAELLSGSLLAACALTSPMPPAAPLFHDEIFAKPSVRIDPDEAFAMSPEMRTYAETTLRKGIREDHRMRLIDALYREDLRLDYDSSRTRTAAEAFAARSGNCLALVLMAGALAKELGVPVHYQSVLIDNAWERSDQTLIAIGHVNLTLEARQPEAGLVYNDPLTMDFEPANGHRQRVRMIGEQTVLAMFANNRAVEAMIDGRIDDAYWWSQASIERDSHYLSAYNTLALVYRNRQQLQYADAALARVLLVDPDNLIAMWNRVPVLRDLGHLSEAQLLAARLESIDPRPPYFWFQQGIAAFREHRFDDARDLFRRETDRAPYNHEFQFWLAVTYQALDHPAEAMSHMAKAMEVSGSKRDRDLYQAKLERMRMRVPGER